MVPVMGFIILMSIPTITNLKAISNQHHIPNHHCEKKSVARNKEKYDE
jgi:hypothetical protein